ncbi:MAG: hypothetical protein FWE98_01205 [Oscillospiraceae bacterium]|nr:hypothetical protein [Oscillospiraceae bacterium]
MKRKYWAVLFCIALLLGLHLRALAIDFDGNVRPLKWYDYPAAELFAGGPSLCGVTAATVRHAVEPARSRVLFGFTAFAPDAQPESPIGVVFLLGSREIGSWQLGLDASFDAANYDLQGLAYFPESAANGAYTFEIALGYKTQEALAALRDLSLQLFDPQGSPSRVVPCPVVTAEPVTTTTTTKAPTTEKTTTTKAPTTEKPTTTKAPTTEKPTATTATTTAKPTTTLPIYTTATAAPTSRTTAAAANPAPAAPQATTAAPVTTRTTQTTQPATTRTEVFYYTVVYTDAPAGPAANSSGAATGNPPGAPAAGAAAPGTAAVNIPGVPVTDAAGIPVTDALGAAVTHTYGVFVTEQTLRDDAQPPLAEPPPQSLPTLAAPAPQPTRATSPSAALLFSSGGLLALLAAGLFVYWLRAQKKPEEIVVGDGVTDVPGPLDNDK